jgi:peptidoglycan hydrolase-like protein with peptidoglycan-binding domain
MAPGWNMNLPDGGCGAPSQAAAVLASAVLAAPAQDRYQFTRDLQSGMTGDDVLHLQRFLNANGFPVATSGPGSSGNETTYFGERTKSALIDLQNAHAQEILTPQGLTAGTGYFGASTRAYLNDR